VKAGFFSRKTASREPFGRIWPRGMVIRPSVRESRLTGVRIAAQG